MPASSLIVGVDLAPIKPIPRTITFQSDITTDKCRATIRQHLKTWKADTVLHDGAPNVGTAWVQDAFSQAELALQAFKLATEFLIEGGTFVTKVFRSKDYNALLWVLNQLFTKVEATKPPSSRNVSAEIFVVCRGFKAPKRIDPKFLDPRSVFAELSDPTPNNEAKVFNPEVKKRKRDGYEEGNYTQFKEALASKFIQTTDPIAMLGSLNKLIFEGPGNGDIALAALERLPETTSEVKKCCMDLKVLGRKEFRTLLKWRLNAREKFGYLSKKKFDDDATEEVTVVTPMDEELQMQEELDKLTENETARKKRERRRDNERKQKEIIRMQLHMMPPTEIGLEQSGPNGEDSMFGLAAVSKASAIEKITRGKMGIPTRKNEEPKDEGISDDESDEEEDKLDREMDALYDHYQERRSESDAKYRAKKARKEHTDGDWEGFSDHEESSGEEFDQDHDSASSSEEDAEEATISHGTVSTGALHRKDEDGLTKRASMFFEQDLFREIGVGDPNDGDDRAIQLQKINIESDELNDAREVVSESTNPKPRIGGTPIHAFPQVNVKGDSGPLRQSYNLDAKANTHDRQAAEDLHDADASFDIVQDSSTEWDKQCEPKENGHLDIDIITSEAMTLAQQIASGEKSRHDLVDEGFNKFTFQDRDGLPEWFLDDENKHSKPHRPITAAGAAAIKEKLRALNARPIKKVREAKDRKKFKAAQRLEKLRKKSALVADEDGTSEKDKAQNIAKLMSKAAKKRPKQQVKVVVARGGNRGISGRPRGVKGRYKIVDARLKKDARAEKRLAKKRN